MARRDGRHIAGALNLFGEGVLFGRNWGAVEYVPFLHFETCYYQAIDFAIARGLKRVEAGAQGEHKLLRGYLPVTTYSAHMIAHAGLRRAVDDFLAVERDAVTEQIAELARHAPFRRQELIRRSGDRRRRSSLVQNVQMLQGPRSATRNCLRMLVEICFTRSGSTK